MLSRTRRPINAVNVRAALVAVSALNPGRHDARPGDGLTARYVNDDGRPNCLVAHVLLRLGITIHVLRALDQEYPTGELVRPGVKITETRHKALRRLDPDAQALLGYVQDRQEAGARWDRIVEEAFNPGRLSRRRWYRWRPAALAPSG